MLDGDKEAMRVIVSDDEVKALAHRLNAHSATVPKGEHRHDLRSAADLLLSSLRPGSVDEIRAVLKPLADEADGYTIHTPDSTPMEAVPITGEGWQYRFTLGDLRRASDLFHKLGAPND